MTAGSKGFLSPTLSSQGQTAKGLEHLRGQFGVPLYDWRRREGNGALPNVQSTRGTLDQKVNERIERHMQNRLAEFKLGRIVLHLLCCCQDRNFLWHWRGILRELSKGALVVLPASKCDATERCFENAGGAR